MSRTSARKEAQRLKDIAPKLAKWALWTAFPSRSANQCSEQAASIVGGHPDTYRRILTDETKRVALNEILPVLAIATAKRGIDLFELLGTPNARAQEGVHSAPVVRRAGEDGAGEGEAVEREGNTLGEPGSETPARSNDRNAA